MLKLLERYNVDESAIETLVERHKSLSVVSMFSGCGGMDLGFLGGFSTLGTIYPKNRYKIIWANDFNQAACRTYRANLGHDVHVGSIWDVMHSLPVADDVDVVIGGFPCQDISVNGKRQGISGNRSGLYRAMVEVVKRVKPIVPNSGFQPVRRYQIWKTLPRPRHLTMFGAKRNGVESREIEG